MKEGARTMRATYSRGRFTVSQTLHYLLEGKEARCVLPAGVGAEGLSGQHAKEGLRYCWGLMIHVIHDSSHDYPDFTRLLRENLTRSDAELEEAWHELRPKAPPVRDIRLQVRFDSGDLTFQL